MCPAQPGRLDSWKAIAEYLERNVRTVTRWADERGMPVHRVPGGKRGAVFAFTEEIDAWLLNPEQGGTAPEGTDSGIAETKRASGEKRNRPQLATLSGAPESEIINIAESTDLPRSRSRAMAWRPIVGMAAVVFMLILISRVLRPASSEASQLFAIKMDVDAVEAQDAQGRTLWSYRYAQEILDPRFFHPTGVFEPARIGDFLGDGQREAAVTITLRKDQNPNDISQSQIDFFSSTGKLLWRYVPEEILQFGAHTLKGPWIIRDLYAPQANGNVALWAEAVHHTWGNGLVLQIDSSTGRDTLRFVNTGTVYPLNEIAIGTGKSLLIGGFNNEWDGGSLAIVNENKPFAASPQTPGTRHHCDSCPAGEPDYYFVFPRSEVNRVSERYENPITSIQISTDGIEVVKSERLTVGDETTVYLLESKPPFRLISRRYNSSYDMLHRAWSEQGKLSHTLDKCPERLHPQPVRLWTPAGGWVELPVKAAGADQ